MKGRSETDTEHNEPSRAQPRTPVRIVGVASGCGAPDPRCAEGPAALRNAGLIARLREGGLPAAWSVTIPAPARDEPIEIVSRVTESVATHVEQLARRGRLPVVLGGDHSCAIGTWKGAARAVAARGALGLIWIDAHMDAHTPRTTHSGRLHGMPLACLLGFGDRRLTLTAGEGRLAPARVCLVGVRSFETGEAALLKRLGVRVFFMPEINRRGLAAVMKDAVAIARGNGEPYGISVDLDALDPREAPGVGTPVAGGLRGTDLLRSLSRIGGDPSLAALEVVEYNPHRDKRGATARLVGDIIQATLAPRLLRPVASAASAPSNEARYSPKDRRRRAA
jgi:arginase